MSTKSAKSSPVRCAVCGREVAKGEVVFSIAKGRLHTEKSRTWGVTHQKCFAIAVDSPDAVLAELKRRASAP